MFDGLSIIDGNYNSRYPEFMHKWLFLIFLPLLIGAAPPPDPAVVHANAIRSGAISYREGWFGEGDTRLHYVDAGEGPLVILYHGFPSFWYSWFDQMEALKGRYRVVAVDALGAGLSAKPQALDPYRIDRLAAQIDALARHLNGKKKFALIGHDWGAALSFAYAQAYPKRLKAVIGMSAPSYNQFLDLVRSNPEQRRRSQYMLTFGKLTFADVRKPGYAPGFAKMAYSGLAERGSITAEEETLFLNAVGTPEAINGGMNWYRSNISSFGKDQLASYFPGKERIVRVPTLLIWGNADTTFVDDFVVDTSGLGNKVTVLRLSNVGHWTPIEGGSQVSEEIASFLDDVFRR